MDGSRAMGKMLYEAIEGKKEKFMTGAMANNIDEDKAETIFDQMTKYAGYGFNKSHAAAFTLIAYQTAFIKAHYLAQFMTDEILDT